MTAEEIEALLLKQPPEITQFLALRYISILLSLHLHAKKADEAFHRGDTEEARAQIFKCIENLDSSTHETARAVLSWLLPEFLGPFALLTVTDSIQCAQEGRRHWLTALPRDQGELTIPSEDFSRDFIVITAAAAFDVFGRRGQKSGWAEKIARNMAACGFRTKRGPPTARTIEKMVSNLRSETAKASGNLRHQKRAEAFMKLRSQMVNWKSEDGEEVAQRDALTLIRYLCSNLVPHLYGAKPVKSGR